MGKPLITLLNDTMVLYSKNNHYNLVVEIIKLVIAKIKRKIIQCYLGFICTLM